MLGSLGSCSFLAPVQELHVQDEEILEKPIQFGEGLISQLWPSQLRATVMRRVRRFLRMFDEAKPEETFYQRPEDQVVRRVQDDLEELPGAAKNVRFSDLVALVNLQRSR